MQRPKWTVNARRHDGREGIRDAGRKRNEKRMCGEKKQCGQVLHGVYWSPGLRRLP